MTTKSAPPVLAVDIGGTKVLTAVFSADGLMVVSQVTPTPVVKGAKGVITELGDTVEALLKKNELKPADLGAIGIACAGGIDTERGVVVTPSPNLPDWLNVPLRDMVEERFGVGVYVLNDASAAALGEQRYGAGRGVSNMVLITLGTGIGGGIIIGGKLYLGAKGGAGEIGHMTIAGDGPDCGCGNKGCLEVLASGTAIAREAMRRIAHGEKSSLAKVADITTEKVAAAANEGDALANEVLDRAAHYLGVGLVNVANIFNPEMIVLGGGMVALADRFIPVAKRMINERAFSINAGAVSVMAAQLGNEAGVYGAAAYAREQITGRQA